MEKRGRSPLLPRKLDIGQQMRTLNPPSILERKNALTSTESRKVHIYDKHTVSSSLYALNTIKQPSVDITKLVPQSKVMSIKSKFNDKKVTNSYMNTTGSTKTKDFRMPHGKKQTRQPTNGFGSKNPRLFDALSSSNNDHNVVTHEEDDKTVPFVNSGILTLENCDTQCMDREDDDILTREVESEPDTSSQDGLTSDEPCISIEHTDDGHDNAINQQNQPDTNSEVDQEFQEVEDEQGVQEVEVGSKDVEEEEIEVEMKEGGEEVPKEEDRTSEMVVKNGHEVVAHGKKDTAAYNYVIEVTLSEQRWNRVKALVGVFETIISCETRAPLFFLNPHFHGLLLRSRVLR
ncbi:hypothetical protein L1987_17243 [Smallanthus sonchifolius]|uniref:Uncharacterized protein n=1 Tax=Smallanthus sonchifolius TaxID=185202 RepID=A0ACB9IXX2_9ASTR|nr:hypothetical protein L1987_17243 [Smallanthus sonchifolius]